VVISTGKSGDDLKAIDICCTAHIAMAGSMRGLTGPEPLNKTPKTHQQEKKDIQ
jgi:hypothetical protein